MAYTVGEMAKRLGVPASTLRYYDKEGLLPFVGRSSGGIRVFEEKDFEWLRIIECLKKTGMSLKDIREYIELAMQGDATIAQRLEMFRKQKAVLEARMAELQQTMDTLVHAFETQLDQLFQDDAMDVSADIDDGAVLSEHDLRPLGHVARGDLDHDDIALLRGLADVLLREVHDDLIIEAAQSGMMRRDGIADTVGIEHVDKLSLVVVDHHAEHFAANITGSTDAGIMDHVCFPPC